jgi:hypothetical protein
MKALLTVKRRILGLSRQTLSEHCIYGFCFYLNGGAML